MTKKLNLIMLYALIFLTPIIFVPVTQDFFSMTKAYALTILVLLIGIISTAGAIAAQKAIYHKTAFDKLILCFAGALLLSVLISAPNKIGALSSLPLGFGIIVALILLFVYISQQKDTVIQTLFRLLSVSALISALVEIIYLFDPFTSISLPIQLSFLSDSSFTLVGSQLELLILLVIAGIYETTQLTNKKKSRIIHAVIAITIMIGALIGLYRLFAKDDNKVPASQLPPVSVSWYATIETLKDPKTALFGVGPDNFISAFSKAKPRSYNATHLWLVNFHQARSAILQIEAEVGFIGTAAFIGILLYAIREALFIKRRKHESGLVLFILILILTVILAILPVTFITLFLLFIILGAISAVSRSVKNTTHPFELSTAKNPALFYIYYTAFVLFLLGSVYLAGRSYTAEIAYAQSLSALSKSNAQDLYQYSRRAALLNPYKELFRRHFSQVNILIADRLAQKKDVTDADRQTIAQAIQGSIQEAKAAVTLNPQKTQNWENLALVYRMVLSVAQGADAWTVASYQRAIETDPVNPALRLALGGVYYTLGDYKTSINYFIQATNLKADWANAYYNLAWAYYQNKEYALASQHMTFVSQLLTEKSPDKAKAQKDLAKFQKLAKNQQASSSAELGKPEESGQTPLSLPQKPSGSLQKQIELPSSTAPEATNGAR